MQTPGGFPYWGAWESQEAVTRWRQRLEFSELLGEGQELFEEFEPHDYTLAASPNR